VASTAADAVAAARWYRWSMHRTISIGLIGLLCMACTRDNPAFDAQLPATEATSDPGDGDPGEGDGDGDASTTLDERDMPSEPACEFQPRDGIAIRVGSPDDFGGGVCANNVIIWMRILAREGGVVEAEVCPEGCLQQCYGSTLAFSLFPIDVAAHMPADASKCLALETGGLRGSDESGCYWGALTIYDSGTMTPYVIATAHSSEPTPAGIEMLGGVIPPPEKAGTCGCDEIGQGNDCCYGADTPPEFLQYPFESGPVLPGGSTELSLDNSGPDNLVHEFKLLQAQHIHSCESPDVQLSWAVLAKP
jgi:hypothetical protein